MKVEVVGVTTAGNAERNGANLDTMLVDWSAPEAIVERGPWQLVIGSDLRVLDVIQSEVRMNLHADKALEILKARQAA